MEDDARTHKTGRRHDVNLVKGKPVPHLSGVARKDSPCKPLKKLDKSPVSPTTVRGHEVHRHVIVVERDHGLDSLLTTGAKYILVKCKAFLVGLGVITIGEDAAPRNREAQRLETHLAKERDILSVMMIEINGLACRVIAPRLSLEGHIATPDNSNAPFTKGKQVGVGETSTSLVKTTFALVGGKCSAPEKIRT